MKTRFYILLSMALLLLTQTSCVYDNNSAVLCASEDTDLLVINMNLTVPSSSTGTRSTGGDLVPGSKDENYINITDNDYQVLMFDKYGALVEGKLSEFECKENGVSGGMTRYTLTTKLSLSGNEDKERLSKFRVMVLANWESFEKSNTQPDYTYPTFTDYNITLNADKNIFKDGDNFNFTLRKPSNNFSWVPSIENKQAIPMFGITEDLDLQFVMDMSKYGDAPSFSVPMLRAMAKVEIIDELGDRISSVSMSSANQSGRFIPEIDENTNTGWSDPGTQIEKPSIPTTPGKIDKIEFVQGPDSEGKRTWVAYIPEMDFTNIDESQRPQFTVYDGKTPLEPKPFNNYENSEVVTDPNKYLPAVLRNHIYSFRVTITDKATLSIEMTTSPWDLKWEDNPTYFETPGITPDGYIKWVTTVLDNPDDPESSRENGYKDITQDARLIMKSSTDEYADAFFTLNAPMYGKWIAYMRSINGATDAFYFTTGETDDSGALVEGGNSGVIDGTPQRIRVACRRETVYDVNNEATLVIMVQYPDNNQVEIYVVDPETLKTNYTIVQVVTEFM